MNSRSIEIDIVFSSDALGRILSDELTFPANTRFVVAYSGGLDSHVLLHALHRLLPDTGYRLRAVHVHHGLQPDADAWARHCEQVCTGLGVSCIIERVRVEGVAEEGVEAAARRARYTCLADVLCPDEVLLTAHHRDDQAETVLLQLLRGTGVHGLAGMPRLALFASGLHVRPLLDFPRTALVAYAQAQGLSWVEDPSNTAPDIDRNRLRHRVLPLMRERWPAADRQLTQAARHAAEAAALLDELAGNDLKDCIGNDGGLQVSGLRQLSPTRARNLLRHWIRSQGFQVPSTKQLTLLQAQLGTDPQTRHAAIRWRNAELRRYRDTLVLRNGSPGPASVGRMDWDGSTPLVLPGTDWQMRLEPVQGRGLARERLNGASYSVGFRRGGEVCRLPGRMHRHKLKKLLQEAGVPPWERDRLPLLYVQGELAAIGDRWVCEPFAAKPEEPGWAVVLEHIAPEDKHQAKNF